MSKDDAEHLDLKDLGPLGSDPFADSGEMEPAANASAGPLAAASEAVEAEDAAEEKKDRKRGKDKKRKAPKERGVRGVSGPSLVERIKHASPYNVMLVASLAMIFVAIVCLGLELYRYDFSISAAR